MKKNPIYYAKADEGSGASPVVIPGASGIAGQVARGEAEARQALIDPPKDGLTMTKEVEIKVGQKKVTCKVVGGLNPRTRELEGQGIVEEGQAYQPGDTFTTTAARASALGTSVVVTG